jgi:hypothetical protein
MIIRVDVDETVCITPDNPRIYEQATPIYENIEKINKLYDQGHTIIYWTARGSRSNINWHNLTEQQLRSWGAKFHELQCNKPYYDLFIDDKTIRIEELK